MFSSSLLSKSSITSIALVVASLEDSPPSNFKSISLKASINNGVKSSTSFEVKTFSLSLSSIFTVMLSSLLSGVIVSTALTYGLDAMYVML